MPALPAMRASRLLSILLLLQTRGRMTADQLAGELEVSVRTVYRDVESLAAAGVPLYADRGPRGGYQLLDGFRTRLTGLTSDEADSLFLAGMPGPAADMGLGTVLAAAQLKLLAALPPELRDRAGRIRERFHLDAPGWFRRAEPTPHLAAVADAVWQQRRVRVRYLRWNRGGLLPVDRTLEPLGVVLKAGSWYLIAQAVDPPPDQTAPAPDQPPANRPAGAADRSGADAGRQALDRALDAAGGHDRIRTYRVVRILTLDPLDEHFDRDADFDLAKFWQDWSEGFEARMIRGEAVIRLSPRGRERLQHWVSQTVSRAAADTQSPPAADGWVTARIPIESLGHATGTLLQLGADLEVLHPPELRAELTRTAAALVELYHADQAATSHPDAGEP